LKRWHQEYEYLCGYSHIGEEKIMISAMKKTRLSKDDKNEYLQREIILSSISISSVVPNLVNFSSAFLFC